MKSFGYRLPKCSARSFHKKVPGQLPSGLAEVLGPIVETVGSFTEKIKDYERRIEELAAEHYPETRLLRQVSGVGSLTALAFVLTLEDPQRFAQSRSVGAYLGLAPGTDHSGEQDPQKRISGEGDEMLRRLLVSSAHYILGPFAPDSDLRRHGEKIAERGGKNAKKRAVSGGGGQKTLRAASSPVGLGGGLSFYASVSRRGTSGIRFRSALPSTHSCCKGKEDFTKLPDVGSSQN